MDIARQFHCRILVAVVGGGEGCLRLFADFPLSLATTVGDVRMTNTPSRNLAALGLVSAN